ncbi:MAG: hypothetical protein KDA89_22045, partial [Planctomycetaceae bacterium]|nr:hypothetical protein [Planctomycetaceae bacterium]
RFFFFFRALAVGTTELSASGNARQNVNQPLPAARSFPESRKLQFSANPSRIPSRGVGVHRFIGYGHNEKGRSHIQETSTQWVFSL